MRRPNAALASPIAAGMLYLGACTTPYLANAELQYMSMRNRNDLEARVHTHPITRNDTTDFDGDGLTGEQDPEPYRFGPYIHPNKVEKYEVKDFHKVEWYQDINLNFHKDGVTGTVYWLEPRSVKIRRGARNDSTTTDPNIILKIRHGIEKSPAVYELYDIIKNKNTLGIPKSKKRSDPHPLFSCRNLQWK